MAPFADEATAWWVTAGTLTSTVLGGLATAVVFLLKGRSETKIAERKAQAEQEEAVRVGKVQERKDALLEWQGIATVEREQHERALKVIGQHQEVIQSLLRDNAACREQAAQQRVAIHFIYGALKTTFETLRRLGHDPGPLPELPDMGDPEKEEATAGRTEFLVRQAAHSASLLKQTEEALQTPPAGGPKS